MRIARATPDQAPAVEALLASAGLPLEGAREALACGVVARRGRTIVGAAALERFGDAGLLRSVVVDASLHGQGVGRAVVLAVEELAKSEGVRALYLLTETAADWFARLGYEVVGRATAASVVGASIEFTTVCRDRGVPMRKRLDAAPRQEIERARTPAVGG